MRKSAGPAGSAAGSGVCCSGSAAVRRILDETVVASYDTGADRCIYDT